LEDVLKHELTHWELPVGSGLGCPYDMYNHDLILEGIKKGLPRDKHEQARYVANAFEDMIINPRAKEFEGTFSGQVLFYDEQGKRNKNEYGPFYEAFVKLNMHLWGDGADKALLKRYYKNTSEVDSAVRQIVQSLGLDAKKEYVEDLFIKKDWPAMAERFARAMASLLEKPPQERLSAFDNPEQGGEGQEKESKQKKPGNAIEAKVGSKEGNEQIAKGRYEAGQGLSPNVERYDQLDSLYRSLAKAIPIHVEAMKRDNSLPIAPLRYRAFDEDTDDIRKAKLSKLKLGDDGITIGYPASAITVTQRSKIQRRSFPDFKMIMLDNSLSMKEGVNGGSSGSTNFIPWGDKSKYHYALLGFYGIESFLQKQGIAQYIDHGMTMFSDSTRYKEGKFGDVKELRKLALSPDWGGTNIDSKVLMDALKGKESFVLSLSDGDIFNWHGIKDEFLKLSRENHYAHIQIGHKNEFTRDLEKENIPVSYVTNGDELSKLMVNVATCCILQPII